MKRISQLLDSSFSKNVAKTIKLAGVWKSVVGDSLSNFSFPVMVKDNILLVGVSDHILKNEFGFLKSEIIEKLKSHGLEVKDIRFFLSYLKKKSKNEKKMREITEKEKKIVEQFAAQIKDEKLREKFRDAMFAYFKVYSYEDFISDAQNNIE